MERRRGERGESLTLRGRGSKEEKRNRNRRGEERRRGEGEKERGKGEGDSEERISMPLQAVSPVIFQTGPISSCFYHLLRAPPLGTISDSLGNFLHSKCNKTITRVSADLSSILVLSLYVPHQRREK